MSEKADQIDIWMEEAGPRLRAEEVRRCGDHLWVIAFDEAFLVEAELVIDRDVLVLGIGLGKPLPGEQPTIHELLLKANTLWRETGGLRFGLEAADDADAGEVRQIFEIGLAGLDLEGLCLRIENFADTAQGWRDLVASKMETPTDQNEDDSGLENEMIRV